MAKLTLHTSLVILFAALLVLSVVILLFKEDPPSQLGAAIVVLAGCTIVAAVLPRLQALSFTLSSMTATLVEQQKDIDTLKFLVTGYVTHFELQHLQKLAGPDPFQFHKGPTFTDELRRLWRHGLISKHSDDWWFSKLPDSGNVKDFVAITDRGKTYLRLLAQVEKEQGKQ